MPDAKNSAAQGASGAAAAQQGAAQFDLTLTRVYGAPRNLVFKAWTDPKQVAKWWGPRGFTNPVCEMDVRVGGLIRIDMRAPDGTVYPMKGVFHELVENERIVFTATAHEDELGNPGIENLNTISFAEQNGMTKMTLHVRVLKYSPRISGALAGMEQGWSESLYRLGDVAEQLARAVRSASASTADREIVISRTFNATRERVWDAWTDPKQVVKWWGPFGFTTTIEEMEVRPGGSWKLTMHGPDGTDYPNKSVFVEIVKPERIVYTHAGGKKGGPGANFTATWTFEEEAGKTKVTIRMIFASPEERDLIAKEYGAIEGGKQTLERLSWILESDAGSNPEGNDEEFVIERVFDAPRDLVFKAWTEGARLAQWWGPKGFTWVSGQTDLRPGGKFHYCMRSPDGHDMWGIFSYREIAPPEKIVFTNSFSDVHGNIVRAPFSATWPLEVLNTLTFAENAGKTTMRLRGTPFNATAEERKTFAGAKGSLQQGFAGTLDQLSEYLRAENRAK